MTFDDIARYTNFSKTTISRYFNNPDSLTLKNQEIIAQALIDLDYKENKVAKILASGKTEFVGIIVPNLYLHYYSEMLNQILSSYEKFGYKFLVFTGSSNEAVIPTSTVGQQIDKIAETAMEILVEQMNERKKRKPVILTTPVHKVITPILINRNTTCYKTTASDNRHSEKAYDS